MKEMKKKLSPIELKAKTGVLEQLKKDMQDMMGEKVAGLKKVTVASTSPKGLEKGLETAKGILGKTSEESPMVEGAEEDMQQDLDNDNEEGESEEHKAAVLGGHRDLLAEAHEESESPEHESEEELDAKIQELLKKKASIKK